MSEEGWRGILVVGQLEEGQLHPATLELLSKARDLTDRLGGRLTCVLVGEGADDVAETAVHHGADRVLADPTPVDGFQAGPLVEPLTGLIEERRPEIVLLSATDLGRDLGPMLGARLDTGVANECIDLDLDVSERKLLAKRQVFGGELEETLSTPHARPQIASLKPGAAREGFPDEMRFGDTETIDLDVGDAPEVLEVGDAPIPDLETADTVVVGGRGVSAEDWEALETLAEALDAPLGATRGAVHGDRADETVLVDAVGREVQPELYLGFGVFGGFEHVKAVNAEWLAAVVRDEEDPIVDHADWALVADPAEVATDLAETVGGR